MNEKQKLFVKHYLIEPNAAKAAIAAGYSEKAARQIGHRLLTNDDIRRQIEQKSAKRADKLELSADYVLGKIKSTVERSEEKGEGAIVLKGCELLGKHLKLFTEKHEHVGAVPVQIVTNVVMPSA